MLDILAQAATSMPNPSTFMEFIIGLIGAIYAIDKGSAAYQRFRGNGNGNAPMNPDRILLAIHTQDIARTQGDVRVLGERLEGRLGAIEASMNDLKIDVRTVFARVEDSHKP